MTGSVSVPVVIIGAGQAGLSVGHYLRRFELVAGRDFIILDRGPGTGGAWQHRWQALHLGSAHRVNDLPGMSELGLSFDTADHALPARDVVGDYYRDYERHYELNVVRPVTVTSVAPSQANLVVATRSTVYGDQKTNARLIVNATGTWGAPFVPHYPGADTFAGTQVHTASYVSSEAFAGQRVIVVGGGTSAIGFMLELDGVASDLTWVSRRPIDFSHTDELAEVTAVAAVMSQDRAARAGKALPSIVSGTGVPVTRRIAAGIDRGLLVARPMFSSIEPTGVRWSDGTFTAADAIVWASGFRPELRHLAPLKLRDKAGGVAVGSGASFTDPRIFFAGYGPQASTVGANRAGRIIARQIVAQL
ncbi:NAD(P)-binding domain-containing protein [Cryobacterium ruanii]|uniref:Pyridine nucleotide-disulfide oxidoreductase n=1 Tax=Cryobacterium ruanii TaxID=1259197 RepID=A0A4R9AL44_9MICO|nr:NAD(P)-binding domain-containing protein [Cryobacterium ruanii]TFD64422.1 pyridine nucleotide-disulfide oxidoreductase [Cryobacterium ruanii]